MVQQNCQEETPRREQPVRSEDLNGEIQCEPEESQPTKPKDDAEARAHFWSIQGDFIYRHHNEPRVQLYVPKEETFPIPLKIHWCYKVYTYWSGCVARKVDWRLLECRFEQAFVRFLERIHRIYPIEREASKRIHVGLGRNWQRFKPLPDRIMCGQKYGRKLVMPRRIEKNKNGQKKSQNLTMLEKLRGIYLLIQVTKSIQKFSKTQEENWKDLLHQPCLARGRTSSIVVSPKWYKTMAKQRSSKQCEVILWNLMSLLDIEQNLCCSKCLKIALPEKDLLLWHIIIWCTSSSQCHKRWRFRMQKLPWTIFSKKKKLKTIPAWDLEKKNQEQEGVYSGRTKRHRKSTLDDSGVNAVFTEQGASAFQMTAAKIMDVIARLPGCDGQAADAVSAYT